MKSPQKTDPNQVKSCVSELSMLLRQLREIENSALKIENSLKQCISNARRKDLRARLCKIDIEELSRDKLNVRLSALREAGVDNLWQLYDMPVSELTAIEGFGEQSAERVKKVVNELAAETEKTIRIRINVSDTSIETGALIQSLHLWANAQPLCDKSGKLLSRHESRIRAAMNDVRTMQNSLTWLLTFGKKKAQAQESAAYLDDQLNGRFGADASEIILHFRALKSMTAEQRLQEFEKNAAFYLAALEAYLPAVEEPSRHGLPAELVDAVEEVQLDTSLLKATLRSYQTFGCKYILHQQRALLGDEMGLGKTVQAIAAMAVQAVSGKTRFMVVCPASVLINWCREIPQHSHLPAVKVHGNDRSASFAQWLQTGGVAVTTYETILRLPWPDDFRCDMLVVDEAHYVKNPRAKRTQAMQKLTDASESVLFMTGTPLENKVDEMCALVKMLDFGISEDLKKHTSIAAAQKFRDALAPVYLRRVREDVLTELPDLIENIEWCELGAEEKKVYAQTVRSGNFAAMRRVSWNAEDVAHSCKAQRMMEICESAMESRRKVIIFSFFLNTLERVQSLLGERCIGVITGSVAPVERQQILDKFKEAPDGAALVCQIQAGGTGLNIQTASVVIFCEPQIKPSLETQAISRAYRMGQVRDVLVHRLLCENTVDDRITDMLREKQLQFDSFADESVIGEEQLRRSEQSAIEGIIAAEQQRLQDEEKAS